MTAPAPTSPTNSPASLVLLLATVVFFTAWLAPGHWYPWVVFQNELVAALAGVLFAVAALLVSRARWHWPASAVFVAAIALLPPLQFAVGQISFRSDALLSFLYLAALALAIAAGARLSTWDRRVFLDALFGALLAAALASTGLALIQWLHLNPSEYIAWVPRGYRPIANIAQPNHLASLLALGLLGALWFYETGRVHVRVLLLVAGLLAFAMALTLSRMIWVAALAVVIALLWVRNRTPMRLRAMPLLVWLGVLAAMLLAVGPLSALVDSQPQQSLAERVEHGGGRLRIWSALVDGLMRSPWVGYGWTQVSRAGLEGTATQYVGETMLRQGHSLLLDLLVWNGIPLGLLIIGAIALWWWRQIVRCDSAERAVVLAAVGVISLHSVVEFPLESFYFLASFGLMVGALESWAVTSPFREVPRAAVAATLAGIAALGAAVSIEYLGVEEASRSGRMLAAGFVSSATLPEPRLLDEPIEYIRFWRTPARAGMSAEELDWMRRLAGRNPSPPSLLRYATALGLNGQPAEATRTLVQLCNMHHHGRCDEGRNSWAQLKQNFPVLAPILYPATPTPN